MGFQREPPPYTHIQKSVTEADIFMSVGEEKEQPEQVCIKSMCDDSCISSGVNC